MVVDLDHLVLVAAPGMGKTVTTFQIAAASLHVGGSPILIQLADWSTEGTTFLQSVLRRPAFAAFSEEQFRLAASQPGILFLLDGWNELNSEARKRAATQVRQLQIELPELCFLISTRRQALDVPVDGTRVDLLPLNESQQIDLAEALQGEAGLRILDKAWRTAGLRELVSIPLYLKTLLGAPEAAPFPTTKEEVLRRFVRAHEDDARHSLELADRLCGVHSQLLEAIAVAATRESKTSLPVEVARRAVASAVLELVGAGQLTDKIQPQTALETLVAHHVLTRSGDPASYSFQHQQFQEWFCSHFVEQLMRAGVHDSSAVNTLNATVLDMPAWEEAVLFASERLARGTRAEQEACAIAVRSALTVDPMLAAEMLFRANDAVWSRVAGEVVPKIQAWHAQPDGDRAIAFMIASGRPEFADVVWPLVSDENSQVRLRAMRATRQFRPSVLGGEAAGQILALSQIVRERLLHEIASDSGADGMDLATEIAVRDSAPEVKAAVVQALAFRGAERHAAEILRTADFRTYDLLVRSGALDELTDKDVQTEAAAARHRQAQQRPVNELYEALNGEAPAGSTMVSKIVYEMALPDERHSGVQLVHQAAAKYPREVAEGILSRVRTGRPLFHGASDLIAMAATIEDEQLVDLALAETERDERANAAAACLGPLSVGRLIDALLEARKASDGRVGDRYWTLSARIARTPASSLIAAIHNRSATSTTAQLPDLADLIVRHGKANGSHETSFDNQCRAMIGDLAEDWGSRLLAANAKRVKVACVPHMLTRAPDVRHLPLLRRLLDDNLCRYRAFREEAERLNWRAGPAYNEATHPCTEYYRWALQAMDAPEVATLLLDYLTDEHFGEDAARLLSMRWHAANEPRDPVGFLNFEMEFSRVADKRHCRVRGRDSTSVEADAIFEAVEALLSEDATELQRSCAVKLAIIGSELPHGQRDLILQKVMAIASPRSKPALLRNLTLSGEIVDTRVIREGIAAVFDAAKSQPWLLYEGYELKSWLQLVPFSSRPSEVEEIVTAMPVFQCKDDPLEGLFAALKVAPGDEAEEVLFRLAETNHAFYENRDWRDAAFGRRTPGAGLRVIDLAASGAIRLKGTDERQLVDRIASVIAADAPLRKHTYRLLEGEIAGDGLALLAGAVAEVPDEEGLLLLIRLEEKSQRPLLSWRTVEHLVTEHVPVDGAGGAYNVSPIPAVGLRRSLLSMVKSGAARDAAARCLRHIDRLRDDYGSPDEEPRHPDLASGKHWPILA